MDEIQPVNCSSCSRLAHSYLPSYRTHTVGAWMP